MKNPDNKTIALLLVVILLVALVVSFVVISRDEKDEKESSSTPTSSAESYYVNTEGVIKNSDGTVISSGDYTEAVATEDYVLAVDAKGTLTLARIEDQEIIRLDTPENAYQLRVVGDDFGYLQQHGDSQFITFLNPETGETSIMKTEHNISTWDASGTAISYHPYETEILGFAEYDGLGWKNVHEVEAQTETIGRMFASSGESYVWAVTTTLDNVIYSTSTYKDVTHEFPVIAKVESMNAVLADTANGFWVVTASSDTAVQTSSQIWKNSGEEMINLSLLGYSSTDKMMVDSEGKAYLPVSYTNGSTPDGLMILNDSGSYDFKEKVKAYVGKG